ncbi:MAG: hypothetical protein ACYDCO_08235 [Armatimonadota bacterium]
MHHLRIFIIACLGLFLAGAGLAQARVNATRTWDSAKEFDECYRNRYLDSLSEPGAVKLVNRVLVTDDMGAGYDDFQPIRGKMQARKILLIDDPRVTDAVLIVDGSVKDCDILVNGKALGAKVLEKSYWHANFERYIVPPALLKAGANEFIFRARENGSGRIRVERSQGPNRSAVSRDGGATWDTDRLGDGGYIDGEFSVRLNIGRYAPDAWIVSPVIDLASAVMQEGIPAGTGGRLDALEVDAVKPQGTSVQAFLRTGPTPDGNEESWSAWKPWPPRGGMATFDRFVQWQLVLDTTAAQQTPVVRRVTARFSALPAAADPAFARVRVAEDANERIVRSSYEFAYADYNGNSRILRNNWKLADVIAPGQTEFEKLALLRQWTREQWRDGWNMGSLNYLPSWDARVILSLAPGNKSLGMCTHYATTYVQCAQALGYPVRSIFRGHALSEAWSNEHKKWMVMDAGMDPNDRRRSTYHFERNALPLSELEVHKAYYIDKKWDDIKMVATNMSEGTEKVEPSFADDREETIKSTQQMFIPLRNNFVDHREPEEPEHGQGYFKFLGFLHWKDAATADIPWTDFFTTREADLYWTLNQAQIHLLRTPEAGTLRVTLDTVTPNFAGYEYRIDGGAWTAWTPKTPAGAVQAYPMKATGGGIAFPWKLHAGRNTLEARPFNTPGLRGIVSRVVVEAEAR